MDLLGMVLQCQFVAIPGRYLNHSQKRVEEYLLGKPKRSAQQISKSFPFKREEKRRESAESSRNILSR